MRTIPLLLALSSALAFSGCAIIIASDTGEARFESAFSHSGITGNAQLSSEKRSVNDLKTSKSAVRFSLKLNLEVLRV